MRQMKARPSILIVDDQSLILHSMYQIFREEYEVFIATSGEQALETCEAQLPDLILLDMLMPGMDGHQTFKLLKANELTSNIPIIFITANQDSEEEARCLDAGAIDVIFKPVNPKVVKAKVHTHTRLKLQTDLLRKFAWVDGLTGLANRRHFDEALEKEWRQCQRKQQDLSLIFMDVDFFKRYNDFYGHQLGDTCLQAIANVMAKIVKRPSDIVARYGGEEFVCLLPETPIEAAYAIAQEFERGVRQLAIANVTSDVIRPEHAIPEKIITISQGVISRVPQANDNATEFVNMADQLLYLAKSSGRARIVAASS
ncbi:MAG: diguanylate cyclase [Burkholderiales bacterium]|nr:diguanylate cyclase [Burkholderiales bacterium]